MSNVTLANLTIFSAGDGFYGIWSLTRAMLAAGYKYKSSSDSFIKDTTGDMTNDKWGVGGLVNSITLAGQTGSSAAIVGATNGISPVTGVTGVTANSVGRFLTITGAATAANNGTFRIVAVSPTTQVSIYNPAAVADGNNGSISWAEQHGGALASIAASTNGRAIVSGLTGMVAPTSSSRGSTGDRLTIIGAATSANNGTFLITQVVNSTSVVIDNPSAVVDANNGSISWAEMSPLSQVYNPAIRAASGPGAWLNLQGPSTIKIPIGNLSPTGYLRGENLTQSSTGAQGELLGVAPDTVGGLGYAVIIPRVTGTGSGPRGWNVSNGVTDNIVGAISGVSITPLFSGTVVEYVQEMVLWKNVALTGHMYTQCVDSVAESTSRFSVEATLSACTATLCPGGQTGQSLSNNAFPTLGTFVVLGTGGTGTVSTGSANWYLNTNTSYGKIQIMVANAIEGSGVSADGSWTIALGNPSTSAYVYVGLTFQRMDDCEEGDVWPYVYLSPQSATNYAQNRTAVVTASSQTDVFQVSQISNVGYSPFRGWRRRGFSTFDAFQEYQSSILGFWNANSIVSSGVASADRVACALTTIAVREPFWIVSTLVNYKQRKGSCRWLHTSQGGAGNDTFDSKKWVQLSSYSGGPCITGPWDGVTIPQNS